MTAAARWTRFGTDALETLEDVVADARATDPLAPVTVVTPSPAVAVALRRELGRRSPTGHVGVGFTSISALAEQLAAGRLVDAGVRVGVGRELLVAAVRVALRADPGRLGPIAGHRTTWEALAGSLVECAGADTAARSAVAAGGGLPAEVMRIHDAVVDQLGRFGPTAVLDLAAEVARAGGPRRDELGTVVVHLPEPLGAGAVDLFGALAAHGPLVVIAGAVGHSDLDAELASSLAPLGVDTEPAPVDLPLVDTVVSANDIDDEVRAVVRRLLSAVDGGTPLHRTAIVHPPGPPYARVVAETLRNAGVPFSGPSTTTLAQTAAGRVLAQVATVVRSGFARQAVVDLWSTGVIIDADGRPLPFARFDERSRHLGVLRGVDQWTDRLDAADARARRRAESRPADPDDDSAAPDDDDSDETERRLVRELAENQAIRDAVQRLAELAAAAPASWSEVASWVGRVLDELCGPPARRSWPDHELDADTAIRTAAGRLVALAEVEPSPGTDLVFDTLSTLLDTPAPRVGSAGAGVLVTGLDRAPVAPLDVVAVVGLVEGQAPRIPADDVLLGEGVRAELGLAGLDVRLAAQQRAFLATLASGSKRLISFARHDQRSGRALVPSRWVVDALSALAGRRIDTESLRAGHPLDGLDALEIVASHRAGLVAVGAGDEAALDATERALAAVVHHGGLDGHPVGADPIIAAGAELVRARRSAAFTRFDGDLHGDGVDVTAVGALSPTSLETYASCPRRWFFGHVLRLRDTDRPEEIHRLQPRDKGSLAHQILEDFFGEAIAADAVPDPGRRWSAADHARLDEIIAERGAELEQRGLTGHPRWWEHDRAELGNVLHHVLVRDDELRAEHGTRPVAVELTFGRRGRPPVRIDLGDGRTIALAGQADRVDRGPGVAVVWDYKYASSSRFADMVKPEDKGGDPLGAGTKLQLVAYGLAVAQDGTSPDEAAVVASYWFLKPGSLNDHIGYDLSRPLEERFRRVLAVLADGIDAGRFPARPGSYQYHLGTFEHCGFCEFDRICPQDRDDEWERVRFDPRLTPLVRLAEEGSSSVFEADEVAP